MINISTLVFNNFQVNTYVLSDETNECVIIDPACDSDAEFNKLVQHINDNSLVVKRIINTHGHVDHIAGVAKISKHFNAPFSMHQDDLFLLDAAPQSAAVFGFQLEEVKTPDSYISDDEEIIFGNSSLKTIHVPGHSPGSIVYYSEESRIAIVGDVLFSGSIGRTDLPKGDYDTLISGIKNKLLTLSGNTQIYCGHGPATTIQQEHDTNPFLV